MSDAHASSSSGHEHIGIETHAVSPALAGTIRAPGIMVAISS
ncbi:hypothetical protein [Nocardia alni]|nr:hypothetical protein [Nocardia alni]